MERFLDARGRFILEDLPHVIEQALPGLQAEKLLFDLFKEQPIKGLSTAFRLTPLTQLRLTDVRRIHLLHEIHPARLVRRTIPPNPPPHP
jgi:hypothetical protein